MACPKGWEALAPLSSPDRATLPLLRADLDQAPREISWEQALETFVDRFRSIQERHGKASVAFLGTGQIPCEELALLGAFAKFGMGAVHGDGNTRQCMATSVVAYKQAFGFDAPPYTYDDFEQSDVLVFVGANPCIAHPIMWERVARNKKQPEIIVIDPRRTETAMAATQHLAIRPKCDLVLFYAIANALIANDWIDREFIAQSVDGFDAFKDFVAQFTLDVAADASGISVDRLMRVVESIGRGKAVSFWWTMGVNQGHEAVRVAQSIINLALITGNLGRPGTGANSITGQCNAMGSRMFSNTASLFAGRDFANHEHRQKVASVLGISEQAIPTEPSWAYDQIMDGIRSGAIKGLWIVATNTAHSWIHQDDARELLSKLEFLVVQDMYHSTDTAKLAHLVLPAAGWGEKEGTFINSERRISVIKRIRRAPGQALSDFAIIKLLAEAWGVGAMFERWESPEATFQILKSLSAGTACDITGIEGYQMLDAQRGIQWPLAKGSVVEPGSERRLFENGRFYHPDGKAKLLFEPPRAAPEAADTEYPLTLLTGRGSSSQWHTGTRTDKSAVLKKLYPQEAYVEINPGDASALGIEPNAWVQVESRRGRVRARAYVTHVVQPGHCFMPMHYLITNKLTFPAFDRHSRQPSYKMSAVRISPAGDA
jgi:assimilatory nitrate reductase catalytic subunit